MTDPFYITTPIYYVNARPHLGHAYTTIIADVATRFHDMRQVETFFLTGTDEHGDKILQAAEKEGLQPKQYVDKISALFRNLWPELNIANNDFIRTTDPARCRISPARSSSASRRSRVCSRVNPNSPQSGCSTSIPSVSPARCRS